jgi:stage V sporulation protein G
MAKALKEGSVKKGGVNKAPTTQRPAKAPAAQGVEPVAELQFVVTRLHKLDGSGATKAFVDVAVNDQLMINGIRIVEGKDGLFMAMPREEGKDGKYYNVVVPLKREVKDAIEKVVLEAYGG